jgi:outer membrane murein-binding lipoprotein Lpp
VIDFRYHLVSIVSIFIALAVGIVLGAGPLQQQIGRTLTSQVATLRQEKDDLRAQLTAVQQQSEAADKFATAVTPQLVASRLGGRSVVLVTLPGAQSSTVEDLGATLRASGATVSGVVQVEAAWVDPARATSRADLTSTVAPTVGADPSTDATVEDRMAALLARALVVNQLGEAGESTSGSEDALRSLKDAGMVTYSGDDPTPATLAVVVSGTPDPETDPQRRQSDLAAWTAIGARLDAASGGTVVSGPPESATSGGVVAAVRGARDVRNQVSTVDTVATPMGRVAVVYALREQMTGESGQYGAGPGASGVLPATAEAG